MSICGLDFGTSNTTLGTVMSDVPVLAALVWAPFTLVAMVPVAVGAVCVLVQIVRTARIAGADKRTRRSAYRAFMRTQYTANLLMTAALVLHEWMR